MLDYLAEIYRLRLEERPFHEGAGLEAWFVFGPNQETLQQVPLCELPCFVALAEEMLVPGQGTAAIQFSCHPCLPKALIGREIRAQEAASLKVLPPSMRAGTVLAAKQGDPIWVLHDFKERPHHYAALPFPECGEGEPLFLVFHGKRFLAVLPLLLFIRTLTDDPAWIAPPLQASFIFDDPNLHWPTYGFIHYERLLERARNLQYHLAFATIPLDAWFIHRPTANLFKENPDYLSLLIHGNNHTRQELARSESRTVSRQDLGQALKRVASMKERTGVEVSKVMAPPHGACNEVYLAQMAEIGYEAATISKGSLRRYNREAEWVKTVGLRPADLIRGLTVFPRFLITRECHNNILIAALLHQPILPMGHPEDVAEGSDVLDELARFINTLGPVAWGNLKQISRSHFAKKFEGRVLRIRMHSRRIELTVPEGIDQVVVEPRSDEEAAERRIVQRRDSEGGDWLSRGVGEPLPAIPGKRMEIADAVTVGETAPPWGRSSYRLWPLVRRWMAEGRDRMGPVLKRFHGLP